MYFHHLFPLAPACGLVRGRASWHHNKLPTMTPLGSFTEHDAWSGRNIARPFHSPGAGRQVLRAPVTDGPGAVVSFPLHHILALIVPCPCYTVLGHKSRGKQAFESSCANILSAMLKRSLSSAWQSLQPPRSDTLRRSPVASTGSFGNLDAWDSDPSQALHDPSAMLLDATSTLVRRDIMAVCVDPRQDVRERRIETGSTTLRPADDIAISQIPAVLRNWLP